MGQQAAKVPVRPLVPKRKTRICVAGVGFSHHTNRAGKLARAIVAANPEEYESWFYFSSKGYHDVLHHIKSELPAAQQELLLPHKTSPFCWLEFPDGTLDAKGGRDKLCEWASVRFKTARYDEALSLALSKPEIIEAWVDTTPGTAHGQNDVE
mmetsp:Transcript_36822/g.106143  ORF Transcript_36822/g.106143 Transcript_36822/m.106143 type:complete len:153 (+) Transcript_36822:54-512(+)